MSNETIAGLKRVSWLPDRDATENGTLLAGQEYYDVEITGGTITGVTISGVTINANELDGTTLASNVVNSSLTGVGTLSNLTVTNPIAGSVTGNAGTVTVADAASDTTTFPLLAGSATGSLPLLTDAGLSYNASTNALTTTTFIGALTGNASTVTTNANLTGAVTSSGNATSLGSFTSAALLAALTDETGTGVNVFGTSPTITTPNIVGTSTNNNASAGSVGEIISSAVSIGSAVLLTTTVLANVTSISLTAGDWDVEGNVGLSIGGATILTFVYGSVSLVSATLATADLGGISGYVMSAGSTALNPVLATGARRISISGTTTVYLVCSAGFTISTAAAYGFLRARRVR